MFLAVLAMVSNTSATSISNIQTQFNRISCPAPAFSGLWNNTGTIEYSGATYNYPNVSNQTLTLTCTSFHTPDGQDYNMGCPACVGWVVFVPDWLGSLADRVQGFFTIVYFILTPANFNILGYTIADLAGIALMFLIGVYAFCYIAIGAMLYKILSPFSGVG